MSRFIANIFINRNYALFMGGSFFSATGSWFLSVAMGWLIWEIGRSEFLLGVANFAQMGPMLVLGLLGGVVADRVERRDLLRATQTVWTLASAALAVVAILNITSIPLLLAPLLVIGVCQAFSWPAWSPFIADLVGPDRLRPAVALNSARFNLTRIIGPALAGVLLAQVGAGPCIAIAAATQLALLASLGAINTERREKAVNAHWLTALREGMSYAWYTPVVRQLLFAAGVMGLLVLPYTVFLPAYADSVLHLGPEGLGTLFTIVGVGAIGGAAASSTRWVAAHTGAAQTAFAAMTGLMMAGFAISGQPILSFVALFFLGFGSIGFLATANATVQLAVPRAVVGRVIGVWTVVNAGTTPVGGVVLGALAEDLGLPLTLAVAGVVATVLSLLAMRGPAQGARPIAAPE